MAHYIQMITPMLQSTSLNKLSIVLFLVLISCEETPIPKNIVPKIEMDLVQAEKLVELPLSCVYQNYPYKLGQVLGSSNDLLEPSQLHPAFYGCFDWHSSVHGHWSLVKLLKTHPEMKKADLAKEALIKNLSKENIKSEVEYFQGKHNKSFERTYGWAWLLKLAEELHTWEDPIAKDLQKNLQPLSDLIVERYLEFLPKLVYPIRVGEHSNTAFGLSFAWDYANTVDHKALKSLIESRAKEFYWKDQACPLLWEPSGYDFLSPCLEEVDIMRRVLAKEEFIPWFENFLPNLNSNARLEPGKVLDREDGKLVHLDGLNFSRAWVLYGLSAQYSEYDYLNDIANEHIEYSLPNLVSDSYEGGHWLGSFAIFALSQ